MKLSQYKYNLPEDLIAKYPSGNRDESRLMILNRQSGKVEHKVFKDVLAYFNDKDVLFFTIPFQECTKINNSMQIPSVEGIKKKQVLRLKFSFSGS